MLKKIMKHEDGNAILLLSLALGGLLLMVGLVIDGGNLFLSKSHLQKTANAAALSGAQELPASEIAVQTIVDDILDSHGETASLENLTITGDRQIKVTLQKNVPLFFAELFGIDTVPVSVYAKAGINPMGTAKGAVPLGINESVELIYGDTYELKVDAGDSVSGNFGVLALEGPGAKLYENSLRDGFDEQLKTGDIVNTQTGNIAGATSRAINYRISQCPESSDGSIARDCPRVMLVLVYQPYDYSTNQMKSVQITGFAYFYVTEPMSKNDSSIKGIFIKRTGTGFVGENNPIDRGAYAIKLIE